MIDRKSEIFPRKRFIYFSYLASALAFLSSMWSVGFFVFLKWYKDFLCFLIALLQSSFHQGTVLSLLFLNFYSFTVFAALSILLEKSLTIESVCSWEIFVLRSIGLKVRSCSISLNYLKGGSLSDIDLTLSSFNLVFLIYCHVLTSYSESDHWFIEIHI